MQLARVSETILDIPPHIRLLLVVAGVIGIGLVVMESLVGNKSHTIEIDKVIHFTGYALLACTFVLALRPLLMVPVLLLLVALGMAVEMLQTLNARDFDMSDQYANALGVTVGAALGLLLRTGYAYLRRELAVAAVRRRLRTFRRGEIILREGDRADDFLIIKTGEVLLSRRAGDGEVELGRVGPGEVVGAVSVIDGSPAVATATALIRTTVYRMSLEQVMESAGGREQPVSLLLEALAGYVRLAADRLVDAQTRVAERVPQSEVRPLGQP